MGNFLRRSRISSLPIQPSVPRPDFPIQSVSHLENLKPRIETTRNALNSTLTPQLRTSGKRQSTKSPNPTKRLHPKTNPTKPSFLQMSGMTFGSIVEADRRLRLHGAWQRQHKKNLRDAEVWKRYEEEYELVSSKQAASQQANQQTQSGGGDAASGKRD